MKKKVFTIDIYIDDSLEDAEECVKDFIQHATQHKYIDDNTILLAVLDCK
jgi:hypothetical protein